MSGQETLIYIDENDQLDAGVIAKGFAKEEVKNRAYINALGAQLAKKYLTSEDIDISNTYNLHSIHKILEEIDISDVMLPNIHMDVRVVFNEEYIFVPKSHFKYEILPDIYLVMSLSNDHKYMKFLGFFDPKLINKNNENEEYYFIEKEKLTSPANLKEYIQYFSGNTAQSLGEDVIENSAMLMVSLIDQDITESDKKQLLSNLVKSADLRDRFIEFENFELLSYKAEHSPDVVKPASDGMNAGFANFDFDEFSENNSAQEIQEATSDEPVELMDWEDSFSEGVKVADEDSAIETSAENLMENLTENLADASTQDLEHGAATGIAGLAGTAIGGAAAGAAIGGAIVGAEALSAGAEALAAGAEILSAGAQTISAGAEILSATGEILSDGMDFIENVNSDNEVNDSINEFSNDFTSESDLDLSEEVNLPQELKPVTEDFSELSNENPTEEIQEDIGDFEAINENTETFAETEIDYKNNEEPQFGEEPLEILSEVETIEEVQEFTELDNADDSSDTEDMPATDLNFDSITMDEEQTTEEFGFEPLTMEVSSDMQEGETELVDEQNMEVIDAEYTEIPSEDLSYENVEELQMNEGESIEVPFEEDFATESQPVDENLSGENVEDFSENDNYENLSMDGMNLDYNMETSLEFNDMEALEENVEDDNADQETLSEEFLTAEDISEENVDVDLDESAIEDIEQVENLQTTTKSTAETVNFDDIPPARPEEGGISAMAFEETMNFDEITSKDLEKAPNEVEEEEINLDSDFGLQDVTNIEDEDMSEEAHEIAALDLEAEDIGTIEPKEDDDDIDFEDLKELGLDVEEFPASGEAMAVSSEELISQIDDILGEEIEQSTENDTSEIFSEQDLENASEGEYLTSDSESPEQTEQDKLEMLFNSGETHESVESLHSENEDMEEANETNIYNNTMKPEIGKKGIIVAAAVIAVLAATVGGGMFLKSRNATTPDALTQNPAESEAAADLGAPQNQTPDGTAAPEALSPGEQLPAGGTDNSNLMTNAPDPNKMPAPKTEATAKSSNELKNPAAKAAPAATADSYVTVSKVMWEVPDYLSYSDKIKSYLQTAGKSIKLSLSSDLLLATEYAYSNQVKIDLRLKNDGTVISAQVAKSSGSNQINDIVLQTVKDTLNVIKPAGGEVPTPDFKLGLIIYF